MLNFNYVPHAWKIPVHKSLRNRGSRSKTTVLGKPCCLTTLLKKILDTVSTEVSPSKGTNMSILENLSTITIKVVVPILVGKSIKKTRAPSCHETGVTGMGYSFPYILMLVAYSSNIHHIQLQMSALSCLMMETSITILTDPLFLPFPCIHNDHDTPGSWTAISSLAGQVALYQYPLDTVYHLTSISAGPILQPVF